MICLLIFVIIAFVGMYLARWKYEELPYEYTQEEIIALREHYGKESEKYMKFVPSVRNNGKYVRLWEYSNKPTC